MKLSNSTDVSVYTVAGASSARQLPEWLIRRRRRSLKNDPEFAHRVELLQEFEFEEASSCVRVSEDGEWIMSTGTYKPQIHTHYLPHLSLSFARHTDSLNQTFILLSADYSKSLHLQSDRFLDFHTPQGRHYSTRIPRYGRDLTYDRRSAEALVPAVGVNADGNGEVFRLNLEVGQFMKAYEVDVGGDDYSTVGGGALQGGIGAGSVNVAAVAEASHNLLAFGTSVGTTELWDSRARARAGLLPPPGDSAGLEGAYEVTALEFHRSGLNLATGASNGLMYVYDLRNPRPLLKKDQGYGFPIHTLTFLDSDEASSGRSPSQKILSADKRIIKIWDARDGEPWTSVEPAVDVNHVAWCRNSGLLLTANEGRQQHIYFIPQLGPAPKWCMFLDNLVEEMAEDAEDPSSFGKATGSEIYENYKFLTLPQLRLVNLDHLVGTTSLLRPYMHGYFVAQKLYEEAKLISNPEIWAERRSKTIREKIEKERESRIRGSKKISVKVNRHLVEKMLEREEKNQQRKAKRVLAKAGGANGDERDADGATSGAGAGATEAVTDDGVAAVAGRALLTDDRFRRLFEDEEYEVDERSREFKSLNPSTTVRRTIPKGLTAVEQEELEDKRQPSSGSESDTDDAGDGTSRPHAHKQGGKGKKGSKRAGPKVLPSRPKMVVRSSAMNSGKEQDTSFESRAASLTSRRQRNVGGVTAVGEKQITFTPNAEKARRVSSAVDDEATGRTRPKKGRRSASGNQLRR